MQYTTNNWIPILFCVAHVFFEVLYFLPVSMDLPVVLLKFWWDGETLFDFWKDNEILKHIL